MNDFEKSYQKLAFVFTHDIKTFEGYIKLPFAFSCFDSMLKHSRALLIYNFKVDDYLRKKLVNRP